LQNLPAPLKVRSFIDVSEPIAGAVYQFDNSNNSRELCAIVDIGAGTTDLALLCSITPDYDDDNSASFSRIFRPIAKPASILYAGDYIDEIILEIYSKKLDPLILRRLRVEIRDIKFQLFETRKAYYEQIPIHLEELERHHRYLLLMGEIQKAFFMLADEASLCIRELCKSQIHAPKQLDVVFVGGGANITSLRNCIPAEIFLGEGLKLPVRHREAMSYHRPQGHLASRFSVALGGLSDRRNWPVDNPAAAITGKFDKNGWFLNFKTKGPK